VLLLQHLNAVAYADTIAEVQMLAILLFSTTVLYYKLSLNNSFNGLLDLSGVEVLLNVVITYDRYLM